MSRTVRRLVRDMRTNGSAAGRTRRRGADPRAMREANRLLVLNCIREQGPLARVTLARRTGLSRTTVSSLIDALLKDGLAREGETQSAAPSGGRRPILVHFNETAGTILGIDLGRTHYTVIATNLAAEVLARQSGPCDTDLGPEATLQHLVQKIAAFVAASDITWDRVVGIGMGMPGPMDGVRRTLVAPPRMPGWHGVDIPRILARELNVPIYLNNDANLGALGESRFGAGRGVAVMAYVKVGTGIGCGLVINGQLYTGSHGFAGELGHVTLEENGALCECGNRGCLETVTAAPAIVADADAGHSLRRAAAPKGEVTHASPALAAGDNLDIADVVRAAQAGDPASCAAIARAGDLIGIALAGLVNLINPSLIVIDGGVARAGELFIAPIRAAIVARSLAAASAAVRIE
ncbi:MAG: ROK family protein, partial [Ktedonobacterales bacterium]